MLNDAEIEDIDQQVRAETPELLERARRRKAALDEMTISGQLRRAIRSSGLRYRDLCLASGLTREQLDDFMTGDPVPATVVDALATALSYELSRME
jgi:hypothetical protein